MANVYYDDVTTVKNFYDIGIGDFFIHNERLYLKLNHCRTLNALDLGEDAVVSFSEDATILLKDANDIEITVK